MTVAVLALADSATITIRHALRDLEMALAQSETHEDALQVRQRLSTITVWLEELKLIGVSRTQYLAHREQEIR